MSIHGRYGSTTPPPEPSDNRPQSRRQSPSRAPSTSAQRPETALARRDEGEDIDQISLAIAEPALPLRRLASRVDMPPSQPRFPADYLDMLAQLAETRVGRSSFGERMGLFPIARGDLESLEALLQNDEIQDFLKNLFTEGAPEEHPQHLPPDLGEDFINALGAASANSTRKSAGITHFLNACKLLPRFGMYTLLGVLREMGVAGQIGKALRLGQAGEHSAAGKGLYAAMQGLVAIGLGAYGIADRHKLTYKSGISIAAMSAAMLGVIAYAHEFEVDAKLAPVGARTLFFGLLNEFGKQILTLDARQLQGLTRSAFENFLKDAIDNSVFTLFFVGLTAYSFSDPFKSGATPGFGQLPFREQLRNATADSALLGLALASFDVIAPVSKWLMARHKPEQPVNLQAGVNNIFARPKPGQLSRLANANNAVFSGLVYSAFTMLLNTFTWPMGGKFLTPKDGHNDARQIALLTTISSLICLLVCFAYTYAYDRKSAPSTAGELTARLEEEMTAFRTEIAANPERFNPDGPEFLNNFAKLARQYARGLGEETQTFLVGVLVETLKRQMAGQAAREAVPTLTATIHDEDTPPPALPAAEASSPEETPPQDVEPEQQQTVSTQPEQSTLRAPSEHAVVPSEQAPPKDVEVEPSQVTLPQPQQPTPSAQPEASGKTG